MRQHILAVIAALSSILGADAQIGYQVAVVDQTTGEPKVNTSVSVTVTISDNAGTEITKTTQSATTNDFGVVSLQIGNESTFADTDWSKLPLWISATVDGVSLGKTQILSVPVAEYAKHTGQLTSKMLVGTWSNVDDYSVRITFYSSGSYTYVYEEGGYSKSESGSYEIDGNFVILSGGASDSFHYSSKTGKLTCLDGGSTYSK